MRDKVLILVGSHRSNGFSLKFADKLIECLKSQGRQVQLMRVNELGIKHCLDCNYCKEHQGLCVLEDDMIKVYDAMKSVQQIVFITPVYFNNVSSRLKTLIDRCQMIFMSDFVHKIPFVNEQNAENKAGYLVSFGGASAYENQFLGNELTVELLMRNLRMPMRRHLKYWGTDHWDVDHWDPPLEEVDQLVSMIMER